MKPEIPGMMDKASKILELQVGSVTSNLEISRKFENEEQKSKTNKIKLFLFY